MRAKGKEKYLIARAGIASSGSGCACQGCLPHSLHRWSIATFRERILMSSAATEKHVDHLRQILLWPIHLTAIDDTAGASTHSERMAEPSPDNPWRVVDDEFGDPAEFQSRHYNEFVSFLPPVQRFLYGQGIGRAVRKTYGESPITVYRRSDIARVRLVLEAGQQPVHLEIAHVDLYFFFDIDVAILALEVYADNLPFDVAESALFRFGRAYPAYWNDAGVPGHCPALVEWLDAAGNVLSRSDYEKREKYLGFVCQHRAPAVAEHWEFMLAPLVLNHSDRKGVMRYRVLEYYRMPYMAYLAMRNPRSLSRGDIVRLAVGSEPGNADTLPYSAEYLADFERRYSYDRYRDSDSAGGYGSRFLAAGNMLVVIGEAADPWFTHREGGILGRFRHQHFLMFLIAHFQRAAIRMFSDRLVASVSALDVTDIEANRVFRREIRRALENFLRFAHRYWFHEVSNHAQIRELFQMTRKHLELDSLYGEVREELQDMGNFLDVEAMRRQNDTVVRLTVVTTFGLIGTVTTGLLGMNLIAWSEQPAWWRVAAFAACFVPIMLLTIYTVMKSRRLSEFLEELSDETSTWTERWRAFWRVWRKRG